MMAALTMDIGWVGICPTLGLPAMVAALGLQASVVIGSARGDRFDIAHNATVLLWIVGNALWMCCEYLWDEDRPEGVLAQVPQLATLDRAMFPHLLLIGSTIPLIAGFCLLCFYCVELRIKRPLWEELRCFSAVAREGESTLGIPLHVYQQLFLLPWLLSDSLWVLCNRCDALGVQPGFLVPASVALAAVALAILGDCIRLHFLARRLREAGQCFVEFLWVAGNLAWFIADVRGEETLVARNLFCAIFISGLCLACWLTATENRRHQRGALVMATRGHGGEMRSLLQGGPKQPLYGRLA